MKYNKKWIIAVLVFALWTGACSGIDANAASRPARPKFRVAKRTKKTATLKVRNSKGVTGYRIYLKKGKKGKWKLHGFVFRSSKIKLTKLKPGKTYYVRLKAWKTRGHSVRVSRYSATVKIGKYKSGKKKPGVSPSPTTMPSVAPAATPGSNTATGGAVTVTGGSCNVADVRVQ